MNDSKTNTCQNAHPKRPVVVLESSDSDDNIIEQPEEDAEAELGKSISPLNAEVGLTSITERLVREWTSPIYAFFHPHPLIEVIGGRRCHEFICGATECKGRGARPCIV